MNAQSSTPAGNPTSIPWLRHSWPRTRSMHEPEKELRAGGTVGKRAGGPRDREVWPGSVGGRLEAEDGIGPRENYFVGKRRNIQQHRGHDDRAGGALVSE